MKPTLAQRFTSWCPTGALRNLAGTPTGRLSVVPRQRSLGRSTAMTFVRRLTLALFTPGHSRRADGDAQMVGGCHQGGFVMPRANVRARGVALFTVGLALALASHSEAATITVYTDRSSWEAAVGTFSTEDFSGVADTGALAANVEHTLGLLTFSYTGAPDNSRPAVTSNEFLGDPTKVSEGGGTVFNGPYVFEFPYSVLAWGADFTNASTGALLDITMAGETIALVDYLPDPGNGFFGIISDTPFSQVIIAADAGLLLATNSFPWTTSASASRPKRQCLSRRHCSCSEQVPSCSRECVGASSSSRAVSFAHVRWAACEGQPSLFVSRYGPSGRKSASFAVSCASCQCELHTPLRTDRRQLARPAGLEPATSWFVAEPDKLARKRRKTNQKKRNARFGDPRRRGSMQRNDHDYRRQVSKQAEANPPRIMRPMSRGPTAGFDTEPYEVLLSSVPERVEARVSRPRLASRPQRHWHATGAIHRRFDDFSCCPISLASSR